MITTNDIYTCDYLSYYSFIISRQKSVPFRSILLHSHICIVLAELMYFPVITPLTYIRNVALFE